MDQNNEIFTAGVPEQIAWRAQYLKSKIGFDIIKYFNKINSVFDYGEQGTKTKEMLIDYLKNKYKEGYRTVVYTDDKFEYCKAFAKAAIVVKDSNKDFFFRFYHILDDNSGIKKKSDYCKIGNLRDLLKNEKIIYKNL